MKQFYRVLCRVFNGIIVVFLLLSLTGCSSAPDNSAKGFVQELFSGNAGKALDYVCIGDSVFLIAVQIDWNNGLYKVIGGNNQESQVLVSGRARITFENLQNVVKQFPDLQQFIDTNHINLGKFGAGLQIGVNFDGFYLKYDEPRKTWCVEKRSITGFYDYLIKQIEDIFSSS